MIRFHGCFLLTEKNDALDERILLSLENACIYVENEMYCNIGQHAVLCVSGT